MPKCYDGPLAFESEIANDFYYQFSSCSVKAKFFLQVILLLLQLKKKNKEKGNKVTL